MGQLPQGYFILGFQDSNPINMKINNFSTYKAGWHFGEGTSFDPAIIAEAVTVERILYSNYFTKTDAFPGFDGEIMVTGYRFKVYVEVTVREDGLINFIFEDNGKEIRNLEGIALNELKSNLRASWLLSGSLQQNISTTTGKNLVASHSKTHQKNAEVGYPLSITNAFARTAAIVYVNMLLTTTPITSSALSSTSSLEESSLRQ